MRLATLCCLLSSVGLGFLVGCRDSIATKLSGQNGTPSVTAPKHGHDENEHGEPQSFSQAMTEVESMKQTICKAFQDGKPNEAHHELHEVGEVLEKLRELAVKGRQLSPEQIDAINKNVEQFFKD